MKLACWANYDTVICRLTSTLTPGGVNKDQPRPVCMNGLYKQGFHDVTFGSFKAALQTCSSCAVLDTVLHETSYIQDREELTGTTSGLPVAPKMVSVAIVLSVCGSCTVSDLSDLFSKRGSVCAKEKAGARRDCNEPALCWVQGKVADEYVKSLVSVKQSLMQ